MRKTIILVTAAALTATTFSLGDAAFAHGGDRGDRGDRAGREPMTRAEVEARTNEAFAKLDVNSDGVLSKADREAGFAEYFAKADSDGNGQLSLAEASAARELRRDEWRDRSADRPRGERREGMGALHRMGGFARAADADGDEQITQAEFSSAALARFDKADADGDGAISRDEHKAMRGGHRGKRGRSAG